MSVTWPPPLLGLLGPRECSRFLLLNDRDDIRHNTPSIYQLSINDETYQES